MLDRFTGKNGRRFLEEALASQKLVLGDRALAEELARLVEVLSIPAGSVLIEQGAEDDDVYFILSGTFRIVANARLLAMRGPGEYVGEMAAVQPNQRRSASVISAEEAAVAKLSKQAFARVASRYPVIYQFIAQELSRRLYQRNTLVNIFREKARVLVVAAPDALPVARAIQGAFANDPIEIVVWPNGTFHAASYTLESLEAEVDSFDFAIAVAHADNLTSRHATDWPSARDAISFELGLFAGRLGRARAILFEPREENLRLRSDSVGLTTVTYKFMRASDLTADLKSACDILRDHINKYGPNNG
jgi:predicted nucleotide-binding protein